MRSREGLGITEGRYTIKYSQTAGTVLFIAGSPRSGSTLLGNILGSLDGSIHIGELYHLWNWGRGEYPGENLKCGCGLELRSCPFWSAVLSDLVLPRMRDSRRLQLSATRMRDFPCMASFMQSSDSTERYRALVEAVYRRVLADSAQRVAIDSSKGVAEARLLRSMRGIDWQIIHLVRDPRGVVWSRQRKILEGRGRASVLRSIADTWRWISANRALARLSEGEDARYMLVRYEDFVRDPAGVLDRRFGVSAAGLIDAGVGVVPIAVLGTNHTVAGNRIREDTGRVHLVEDRRWETDAPRWLLRVVKALAWREMRRYGYAP